MPFLLADDAAKEGRASHRNAKMTLRSWLHERHFLMGNFILRVSQSYLKQKPEPAANQAVIFKNFARRHSIVKISG